MALYWEDWSDYTAGDDPTVDSPAGWTRRWHADEAITISDISADSPPTGYTKALHINFAESDRRFYSLDAVDGDADRATVKIALLLRNNVAAPAAGFTTAGAGARGSGTTTAETAVVGALSTDSSADESVMVGQYSSSVFTFDRKSVAADAHAIDTWYWLVLDVDGTTGIVTLYAENDPGGVEIVTHTSTGLSVTAAGWAGIFQFATGTDIHVAAVEIATGATALTYAAPDATAPVISLPTGTQTGSTTADGTVSTDEANGTLYAVVTTSATAPGAPDMRAGTGAVYSTSQAVTATGSQSVAATGLTASTVYYWHYIHDDAAGNVSNIVSSTSFTTAAAATVVKGARVTLHSGATTQNSVTGITAMWWDASPPTGNPVLTTASASTSAAGVLQVDIDSVTALALTNPGHLMLYKLDGTDEKDSLAWQGRLLVVDIS